MTETVRKITLSRAMRTMQDLFPVEYNFYPRSWILPEELSLFVEEVHNFSSQNTTVIHNIFSSLPGIGHGLDVWMLALFVTFWNKLQNNSASLLCQERCLKIEPGRTVSPFPACSAGLRRLQYSVVSAVLH